MKWKTLALAATIFATAVSCSHDDEPEPYVEPAKHTVLMFFPYASDLSGFIHQNILALERGIVSQKGMDGTDVIVFSGNRRNGGVLYRIEYDGTVCTHDTLRSYSSFDYTQTSELTQLMNQIAAVSATGSYSMVTGSHGTGWLPKGVIPTRTASRAFGGNSSSEQINVEQLDSAIRLSSIGKMNYILFDDCYMASAEVAYVLKEACDYLIASTSEIMGYGLPYEEEWKYLSMAQPDYSAIVDEFYNYYSAYSYPYGTLSVIRTSGTEKLAEDMKTLNSIVTIPADSLAKVQALDGYTPTIFYDFKDYIRRMPADQSLRDIIYADIDDMIVATKSTEYLYSEFLNYSRGDTFRVAVNCGLTISDPTLHAERVSASKLTTRWWKATH